MLGPGPGTHNVLRQPDAFQKPDRQVGDVTLPPAMAVRRRTLFGTVVIVPAFAIAYEADEPVVAAVLIGGVCARCVSELTLHVMCQTAKVRTMTPHTSTLEPKDRTVNGSSAPGRCRLVGF